MPSRLLLISANGCTAPDPVFPLGLAHLNAALRRAGHQTSWFDVLTAPGLLPEALRAVRPDFVGISLRNIDDVTFSRQETFFADLLPLTAVIRREVDCPIILGGSGFSIFPERLLELAGADFGIVGEGESALPALIEALENRRDHQAIPGLVFRQGSRILANPPATASLEQGLAEADRPGPVAAYYVRHGGMLNLQTQRGCALRCCYCTYPLIEGRRHRRRPPEVVAEEFEQLQRCGARSVILVDSVFNSSAQHVTEVCEALLRRQVKVPWGCFLRPQGLTVPLMCLMARAGLAYVEFGSDSFCDDVLAAYDKGLTYEDILHSSQLARAAKIDSCHFLIAGGPGETMGTLEQGFQNSLRLPGAVVMAVAGMRVYPGTPLFQRAVAAGRLQRQTDLLAPAYYVEPGLTAGEVLAKLKEFSRKSPNWIAGDPDPGYLKLVSRLRQRGVAGPLWSYFSTLQRLWPRNGGPAGG
jgi:radical SAM superfamily enzyme YgiQ (UPF0313 family)